VGEGIGLVGAFDWCGFVVLACVVVWHVESC
jgi:hypothetical protein